MSEQTKRETWRGWLPPGAPVPVLMTRTEVLAAVERLGVTPSVDTRTLRFWETVGIIPRPTLAHVGNATRTQYPWWVVDLVAAVRRYQQRGFTVKQILPQMRAEADWLAFRTYRPDDQLITAEGIYANSDIDAELLLDYESGYTQRPIQPAVPLYNSPEFFEVFTPEFGPLLNRLVESLVSQYGVTMTKAEIRLTADDPEFPPVVYAVPLPFDETSLEEGMVDDPMLDALDAEDAALEALEKERSPLDTSPSG